MLINNTGSLEENMKTSDEQISESVTLNNVRRENGVKRVKFDEESLIMKITRTER